MMHPLSGIFFLSAAFQLPNKHAADLQLQELRTEFEDQLTYLTVIDKGPGKSSRMIFTSKVSNDDFEDYEDFIKNWDKEVIWFPDKALVINMKFDKTKESKEDGKSSCQVKWWDQRFSDLPDFSIPNYVKELKELKTKLLGGCDMKDTVGFIYQSW